MFELEEFSTTIHEGFFSKYADAAGPSLDFYVSDSMQDMIDVDIRAEIANVVGTSNDLTSSLDHALEAISAINSASSSSSTNNNTLSSSSTHNNGVNAGIPSNMLASSALHASPTAKWMGSCANFWSTADYYADVGACVNPISVMPLINSSSSTTTLLNSPQKSSSSSSKSSSSAIVPASPCGDRDMHKSHLTFSPAQMKVSAGSMRREQVMAHIPKQIPAATTTINSSQVSVPSSCGQQQRRNSSAVDSVKKDLATELRKEEKPKGGIMSGTTGATNTIKLAPGIGGLTFANSVTYNKLKQQTAAKSPNGVPLTANGNILLKRDRESSPLQNMTTLHQANNGGPVSKRSLLQQQQQQSSNVYSSTPKSIASAANSPLHQMQYGGGGNNSCIGSPSTSSMGGGGGRTSSASSPLSFSGAITPLSSNSSNLVNIANNGVKPLQQKIKLPAVDNFFPKPAYSYSCLIALALKNSRCGSLPVSEIYSFLCQHFPYFENAPSGWKNSVRHNLSLNKCFEKIERPVTNGNQRKGCRWAMNPERISKMDEEVQKWSRKDPAAIRDAMVYPEHLESLERGEMKHGSADSDVELDSQSEIEEASDLEEQDFDAMLVEEDEIEEDDEEEDVEHLQEEQLLQEYVNNSHTVVTHHHHHLPIDSELLVQKTGDFDIEVDEMYDAIEFEDDKDMVRRVIANGQATHIIELNPSDLNGSGDIDGFESPKRPRLDINYAIGPAGELEHKLGQKVKVQTVHQGIVLPTHNRRKMPLVNRII